MNWFTAARRKAIYAAAGSLGSVLILLGVLSEADVTHYLGVVGALLNAATAILAIANLSPDAPLED